MSEEPNRDQPAQPSQPPPSQPPPSQPPPSQPPPATLVKAIAAHPYDRIDDIAGFMRVVGKAIYDSGFFGCNNQSQGEIIALDCLVRKVPILERAATDHIVSGKLSMRADAMLADFKARGGTVKWINQGDDGLEARASFKEKNGDKLEVKYSMEDARMAGLVKRGGAYEKNPGEMLRARLVSKGIRMVDPEVVSGRYTPEELDPDSASDAEYTQYVPVQNVDHVQPLKRLEAPPKPEPQNQPLPQQPPPEQSARPTTPPGQIPPATSPAVGPSAPPSTLDTAAPGQAITISQLDAIKDLKARLGIDKDAWAKILANPKLAVATARDLSFGKAQHLIAWLRSKLADSDLNEWANKVSQGTTHAAGDNGAGNGGQSESAPFQDGN